MTLTTQQQQAKETILSALESPDGSVLLTGYAGTGKTYLLSNLCETLQQSGHEITIAAPTHKAAAVVRSMLPTHIRADVSTIHKIFGMMVKQGLDGKSKCTPPSKRVKDVLIVDESSMIGQDLYRAIMPNCERVLFVGDSAQLPPMDDNDLSPVFTDITHRAHLSEVMRQAADNPIIQLATWIRDKIEKTDSITIKELIAKAQEIDPDETKIQTESVRRIPSIVVDAQQYGLDARMIGYTNATTAKAAHDIKIKLTGNPENFSAGDPVYFNQPQLFWNQEKRQLEVKIDNNTECFVLSAEPPMICGRTGLFFQTVNLNECGIYKVPCDVSRYRALKKRLEEEYAGLKLKMKFGMEPALADQLKEDNKKLSHYLITEFADIRINHALTIHKSQGSTFDCVVLDLRDIFKMREHLLRALYVAITRPSKFLVLCS